MLVELRLSELAVIVGGQLVGMDSSVKGVTQDTRNLEAGMLYVALKGENFDGHSFIEQAQTAKACGALVEKLDESLPDFGQVLVKDSLEALSNLAAWHRQQFTGSVVAITGSAGKTTTKALMANVLSQNTKAWMTPGNLNNHIGVPLTLMGLKPEHTSAVIELGASAQGEIAATAKLVKPNVAIITNASEAHLEGFKDLSSIVKTKGELLDFIQDSGYAVLNKDDANYEAWFKRATAKASIKVISFGVHHAADVQAVDVQHTDSGCVFTLSYQNQFAQINFPLLGEHNLLNALAVSAAALALGLSLDVIAEGLSQPACIKGRLNWVEGFNNSRLLDDSYNASPASVYAAIDVLAQFENSILALGELGELGDQSPLIHQRLGEYAKQKGIKRLLGYGSQTTHCVQAFGENAACFSAQQALIDALKNEINSNSVLLVKGSRSSAMDKVVDALSNNKKGESQC